MTTFTIEKNANLPAHLMAYMEKALEHSYEGEILTLLVAYYSSNVMFYYY